MLFICHRRSARQSESGNLAWSRSRPSSTKSWQARVAPYKNSSHHVGGPGWKRFCRENRITVGDICTINIFETTLWHIVITYKLGLDSTCTSGPLCDGDGGKSDSTCASVPLCDGDGELERQMHNNVMC